MYSSVSEIPIETAKNYFLYKLNKFYVCDSINDSQYKNIKENLSDLEILEITPHPEFYSLFTKTKINPLLENNKMTLKFEDFTPSKFINILKEEFPDKKFVFDFRFTSENILIIEHGDPDEGWAIGEIKVIKFSD